MVLSRYVTSWDICCQRWGRDQPEIYNGKSNMRDMLSAEGLQVFNGGDGQCRVVILLSLPLLMLILISYNDSSPVDCSLRWANRVRNHPVKRPHHPCKMWRKRNLPSVHGTTPINFALLGSLKGYCIQISNRRRRCLEPECLGPCPTSSRPTRKNHRVIIKTTFETCTSGWKREIQFKSFKTLVYLFRCLHYWDLELKSKKPPPFQG